MAYLQNWGGVDYDRIPNDLDSLLCGWNDFGNDLKKKVQDIQKSGWSYCVFICCGAINNWPFVD